MKKILPPPSSNTSTAAFKGMNAWQQYTPELTREIIDALSRQPDLPAIASKLLTVPETIGAWSIKQTKNDGFLWQVKEDCRLTDQLRYHLKSYETRREENVKMRLLLIGESAAGSWGFFGKNSLGNLLSHTLSSNQPGSCEVIDLTCVNANWHNDCLQYLHSGMTLNPDAVILYAGNNEARWLLPSIIQSDLPNLEGVYDLRWEFLTGNAEAAMDGLSQTYCSLLKQCVADTIFVCRKFDVPVIFIIPPYNYQKWIPPEQVPSHLKSDEIFKWFNNIEIAEEALKAHDIKASILHAENAIHIDHGRCQRSHSLLARALKFLNPTRAEYHFKKAAFSGFGPYLQAIPSMPAEGAEILRKTLKSFEVPYVDLAAIFESEDSPLIDNETFFLDYCHLSDRGHQVATREIRKICHEVGLPVNKNDLHKEIVWGVSSTINHELSLAALCAALHSYQNGQPTTTIVSWLKTSTTHSKAITPLLLFLRDILCTYRREWITLDYLNSKGLNHDILPERFAIFILKFIYHSRFDFHLFDIISGMIDCEIEKEKSYQNQTKTLLQDVDGNLSSMFFLDVRKGFGVFQREMSRRGWEHIGRDFVAYLPKGQVLFPGATVNSCNLRMRLSPPIKGVAFSVSVCINNRKLGQLKISRAHTIVQLPIPQSYWNSQINELSFTWDKMWGPADIKNTQKRTEFIHSFGRHPISAIIHEIQIVIDPK